MDVQDQFVAINVGKVSSTVFRKENQCFQVSGKEESRRKSFVDNGAQYAPTVLRVIVSTLQITKQKFCSNLIQYYKNISQLFN